MLLTPFFMPFSNGFPTESKELLNIILGPERPKLKLNKKPSFEEDGKIRI